jgi:hypothetical protein
MKKTRYDALGVFLTITINAQPRTFLRKRVKPLKSGVTKPTGPKLYKDGRVAGEKKEEIG